MVLRVIGALEGKDHRSYPRNTPTGMYVIVDPEGEHDVYRVQNGGTLINSLSMSKDEGETPQKAIGFKPWIIPLLG